MMYWFIRFGLRNAIGEWRRGRPILDSMRNQWAVAGAVADLEDGDDISDEELNALTRWWDGIQSIMPTTEELEAVSGERCTCGDDTHPYPCPLGELWYEHYDAAEEAMDHLYPHDMKDVA